ncbi:hypothetical protein [Halovenus sp. HT40]|uniref:hypothetical protein n=1 Tax=Halovenus sp. HT40 TaxID=3126691 RepID=UPI00300F2DC4
MTVTLGPEVLFQYYRFSLYNSPFTAHDEGCAIDLYPESETAPSPVAGEVIETKTVEAPSKPYAAEHDHLILIDTGEYVARTLHVDPSVEAGDTVAVGDPLGDLVRAGFFAPWVPNHIHLGFRTHEDNPYRASGSLPISVEAELSAVPWDGTGTVTDAGKTWVRLDAPGHPDPGNRFAGVESGGGVLDGGFPHYDGGGVLAGGTCAELADRAIGTLSDRTVSWTECTVLANGTPITGVALFCGRDRLGVKLVDYEMDLSVGEEVTLSIEEES